MAQSLILASESPRRRELLTQAGIEFTVESAHAQEIKEGLPEYVRVEEMLQDKIWERFLGTTLTEDEKRRVYDIDDDMLSMEFHQLMPEDIGERYKNLVSDVVCEYRDPVSVEKEYMAIAMDYSDESPNVPFEYRLVELLIERGYHITFSESCTAGLASARLVNVPDASRVMDVGFVTYANEAKVKYLGVSEESIERHGVVSEQVAGEMAFGAASSMGAEVGVGISGIAGPTGGTPEKPVGTVCFGISVQGTVSTYTMHFGNVGRNNVRMKSVDFIYEKLIELLSDQAS